jgi:hypothetical protein
MGEAEAPPIAFIDGRTTGRKPVIRRYPLFCPGAVYRFAAPGRPEVRGNALF